MMKIGKFESDKYTTYFVQLRHYNLYVRIREWYKHKRRINRLAKGDVSWIEEALKYYEEKLRRNKVEQRGLFMQDIAINKMVEIQKKILI